MRGSIDSVQAHRGIAALAVVLWHASRYLGPYGSGIGGTLFAPGAAMGVDLFFLISGFIMFHTTRHGDGSWRDVADFAIKRDAHLAGLEHRARVLSRAAHRRERVRQPWQGDLARAAARPA